MKKYLVELCFQAKNKLLRERLQQFLQDIDVTEGSAGVWPRTGVEVVRVKLTRTQYRQLYNRLPFSCGYIDGSVLARDDVPYERPHELGWGI